MRYAETAELVPTLLEEGNGTDADVFISQDAGALAALAGRGLLGTLPSDLLTQVEPRFRDPDGRWVGLTGRARTIVYNTASLREPDVPEDATEVSSETWRNKVGIAPTNASFVAWVAALRETIGAGRTRIFLEALRENGAKRYDSNVQIVKAVATGEIQLGLVNHYYVLNERRENPSAPVANAFPKQGAFVNVSGAAILRRTDQRASAERLVRFLLSPEAQRFFRVETAEYPLVSGVGGPAGLPPLRSLKTIDVPLSRLGGDLRETVELIKEVGLS